MSRATPVSLHVSSGGAVDGRKTLVRFGLLARTREKRAALRFPLSISRADGKGGASFALSAIGVSREGGEAVWCLAEAALPPGRYKVGAGGKHPLFFQVPRAAGSPIPVFCPHGGARPSRMERFVSYTPYGELLAVAVRIRVERCCAPAILRLSRIRPDSRGVAVLYDVSPVRRETLGGVPLTIRRGEYAVTGPAHRTLLSPRQPFPSEMSVVRAGAPALRSVRELLGLGEETDPFGFDVAPLRMTLPLREALNQVARAAAAPRAPGHHLAVTAACQNLILFLLREHPNRLARARGRATPSPRSPEERLRRAMAYIEDHHAGPCLLREIAAATGVSQTRLITLFKERLQTTPNDHLQDVRIGRAKVLLADRARTIAAVADAVGYRDVRHFRRVFKAHTGKKVRAFRVW